MSKNKQAPDDKQAIHEKPPTIEIEGHEYQVRRVSVRDFFAVGRIVGRGMALALQEGQDMRNMSVEQLMTMFAVGLPYAEEDGMNLMASLLGVDTDDLDDPDQFPISTILKVGESLAEHQDLRDFFAGVRAISGKFRATRTTSRKQSAS